jgi:hypothetical protein
VPRDALPFFDKRPEFIQLALLEMIMLEQVFTDLLAMRGSLLKHERYGVFINVKDPGAGTQAIAFSQRFEHSIDGLLICMEASKDAVVASRELSSTLQTTIERGLMWPVIANQLEIRLSGFAAVGTAHTGSRFHLLASIEKNGSRRLLMLSDPHQLGKIPHE